MRKKKYVSYPLLIAAGFLVLVLVGTALLMMPFASRSRESVSFVDALFTATSASCVTGLVVFDTYTQWSLFGQIVIILLIQIGGLGFMTVITMFSLFLKRKIGLAERSLMRESINTMYVGGIVRLTKRILLGTLIFELAGAALLAVRFVPQHGFWRGVFYAFFHSVSAFCNAGFDLMGRTGVTYSSLTSYVDDPLVILTVSALIIVGGIGFFVWDDVCTHKLHFRKYSLHTKIVLVTTALLLIIPTVLFLFFERDNLFAPLSPAGKLLGAWFSSVTPRTAGFNSIDTAALAPSSKLLTLVLMFIGGSPGSTAGGVKTTTLAVVLIAVIASIRQKPDDSAFGRRLEPGAFKRASAVVLVNLTLAIVACLLIGAAQPALAVDDVLFEVFSAIGTVGMSTGITRDLSTFSRLIISLLMYCGRVGSLSFALIFTENRSVPSVRLPLEKVNIG